MNELHTRHSRIYESNKYVYPVVSRRSKGVSLGVNLNPGKNCNYDCVYCQVDRSVMPQIETHVDVSRLMNELDDIVNQFLNKSLFGASEMSPLPDWYRLNDVAFSGDGEPTLNLDFPNVVHTVGAWIKKLNDDHGITVKMVLISNGTLLGSEKVASACRHIVESGGELWIKWDATTQSEFENVYDVSLKAVKIIGDITHFAKTTPVVLQTMIYRKNGNLSLNMEAYTQALKQSLSHGSRINGIQLYTLARPPKESMLVKLTKDELLEMAGYIGREIPVPVECFD